MNEKLKSLSEKIATPARVSSRTIHSPSLTSRMYLAVARKTVSEKLIHIYTLGLPAGRNESFYLSANSDVAVFSSVAKADSYEKKIHKIMQTQSQWPLFGIAQNALRQELEVFNEKLK